MAGRKLSFISVVIPVAPDRDVKTTLDALKKINYPKSKIEIFIATGKNPSEQRNKGIKMAKGDIILFLDNDSILEPNYFSKMVNHHKDNGVVGGPALTLPTDTFLQKAFGHALGSYFATQRMSARFKQVGNKRLATEKELILCNLSIKKKILDKFGAFDNRLYPNEENELLNRLQKNNVTLLYDPNLPIYRSQRETIRLFIKQIFTYGKSRMEHLRISPSSFTPLFLIPSLFVVYLLSLIFFHPFWYLIPCLFYFLLDFAFTAKICFQGNNLRMFLLMPLLFPLVHISYGIGIIFGIFANRKKTDYPIKLKRLVLKE